MVWFSKSQPLPLQEEIVENCPIYIIAQFFIHRNSMRQREIMYCLRKNLENPLIQKIYLLNERIYSPNELGLTKKEMKRVKQINIQHRITFRDIFDFIDREKIEGFVVALNSDIMVDSSIMKIKQSPAFQTHPTLVATLRYEYTDVYVPFDTNCKQSKIFGPRGDSQDSWIIHSRHNVPVEHRNLFAFEFGKPGCDNKVAYLFHFLNYHVYNDPLNIKTYHYHNNPHRDYTVKDRLQPVFEYFGPAGLPDQIYTNAAYNTQNYTRWNFEDNDKFRNHLTSLVNQTNPFVIPAIFPNMERSEVDKSLFDQCTSYFAPDTYNIEFKEVQSIVTEIRNTFPQKQWIWSEVRTILHFVHRNPWTWALANKRLLIVSPYANKMKQRNNTHEECFPVKLFRNNTIYFTSDYQKHGDYEYDIALIDEMPKANTCAHVIFGQKKSAIVMGKRLRLMFGLYDQTDLATYSDHIVQKNNRNGWVQL